MQTARDAAATVDAAAGVATVSGPMPRSVLLTRNHAQPPSLPSRALPSRAPISRGPSNRTPWPSLRRFWRVSSTARRWWKRPWSRLPLTLTLLLLLLLRVTQRLTPMR